MRLKSPCWEAWASLCCYLWWLEEYDEALKAVAISSLSVGWEWCYLSEKDAPVISGS